MSCEIEERDGCLRVRGEMTIYGAAGLKADLFEALSGDRDSWSLDLKGVSEIDTTGLQLMLAARRACIGRGATLTLLNPSANVREALDLLKITEFPVQVTAEATAEETPA